MVAGPDTRVNTWLCSIQDDSQHDSRQMFPTASHALLPNISTLCRHHDSNSSQPLSPIPIMPMEPPAPNNSLPLTRGSVQAAHKLIQPHIHRTPVLTNTTLSNLASTPQPAQALKGTKWEGQEPAKPKVKLFFKCENFQKIGAFKVRGAFHAVLRLIEERGIGDVRKRGVVTHSSGLSPPDYSYTYYKCG